MALHPPKNRFGVYVAPAHASELGIFNKMRKVLDTESYQDASDKAIKLKREGKRVWLIDKQDNRLFGGGKSNPRAAIPSRWTRAVVRRVGGKVQIGFGSRAHTSTRRSTHRRHQRRNPIRSTSGKPYSALFVQGEAKYWLFHMPGYGYYWTNREGQHASLGGKHYFRTKSEARSAMKKAMQWPR